VGVIFAFHAVLPLAERAFEFGLILQEKGE